MGVAPAVDDAAFSMAVSAVGDPITTDGGTAVIKVLKQETSPDQLALAKDKLLRSC